MIAKGLATAPDKIIGRHVLDDGISTPLMILRESALQFNIERMAGFCRRHKVALAPHVKTTMSPEIVRRQLAAGAWGITVANVSQAIALEDLEPDNLLIANEVVDPGSIAWLNRTVAVDETTIYVYVDSVAGVKRLAAGMTEGVLNVLLEVGLRDGRAGVRSISEAVGVVEAVRAAPTLCLTGVATFEGILGTTARDAAIEGEVRRHLDGVHALAGQIASPDGFEMTEEVILTGGGSAYFDIVAEVFSAPLGGRRPKVILRSGCYVTHDHGAYARSSPFRNTDTDFRPAIEVIGSVLSRPEPHLALCDMGRRDVPFDAGLPAPLWMRRADNGRYENLDGPSVLRLNDQHAYVDIGGRDIQIGDRIAFGISHPCTAFDKWRVIPLVNDGLEIVELFQSRF